MNENLVQPVLLMMSTITIPIWLGVGHYNKRVGWYVALPVTISALTAIFYAVVLFTDLNDRYVYEFVLMSSWLRLFVMATFCGGGLLMLRRAMERAR